MFKCDKEAIRKRIESMRDDFEEDTYVSYMTETALDEKQYNDNIDKFLEHLERMTAPEFQQWCIENAKRKKNDTFYNGRVVSREACDNCTFIQEWHNTWIYSALTVKAIDDTTLELTLQPITDTPG